MKLMAPNAQWLLSGRPQPSRIYSGSGEDFRLAGRRFFSKSGINPAKPRSCCLSQNCNRSSQRAIPPATRQNHVMNPSLATCYRAPESVLDALVHVAVRLVEAGKDLGLRSMAAGTDDAFGHATKASVRELNPMAAASERTDAAASRRSADSS